MSSPLWSSMPPAPAQQQPPVDEPAEPIVEAAPHLEHGETLPGLPEERPPWWKRALSGLAVAGALLLKFGKFLLLGLKGAKIFTTAGTMLVSIVAYSFIWGWWFALGFVALLFVHEMGHVIQLRREGIPASAPMFVPFMGAVVMAKSLGDDASAEARVGLAGPILGVIGTLALLPIALSTDNDFWYALIFTGLFLNLFNLLPVVPLDGGRAMAALSPRMWFVGLFALALLTFLYPNPIIILILLLGAYETYKRWKAHRTGDEAVLAFYRVKTSQRVAIAVVYLGLIAVCAIGMDLTHVHRSIPH
jgi:Zn-dependent protease